MLHPIITIIKFVSRTGTPNIVFSKLVNGLLHLIEDNPIKEERIKPESIGGEFVLEASLFNRNDQKD